MTLATMQHLFAHCSICTFVYGNVLPYCVIVLSGYGVLSIFFDGMFSLCVIPVQFQELLHSQHFLSQEGLCV